MQHVHEVHGPKDNTPTTWIPLSAQDPPTTPPVMPTMSTAEYYTKVSFLVVYIIAGAFQNSVLLAVVTKKRPKTIYLYVLMNQCAVDLLTSLICLPSILYFVVMGSNLVVNDNICRLLIWVSITLYMEYNFNLIVMLIDRIVAVKYGLTYYNWNKRHANQRKFKIVLSATWIFSAMSAIIALTPQIPIWIDPRLNFCAIDVVRVSVLKVLISVLFSITLLLICTGYSWLYYMLRSKGKLNPSLCASVLPVAPTAPHRLDIVPASATDLPNNPVYVSRASAIPLPSMHGRRGKKTLTRSASLIFVVDSLIYLGLWLPVLCVIMWFPSASYIVTGVIMFLVYGRPAINPLVYGVLNKSIRQGVYDLFKRIA